MSNDSQVPRREALRAAVAAPFAAWAMQTTAAAAAPRRPNVLVVHCHDLGRFLGCYGIGTVQTPQIDRFAAEGVRFEQTFCTAPQCSPSRASLFTGRYPHANGVMGLTHANFAWDLHPGEQHIAQRLKALGYRTACVGIRHESRSAPERSGFDTAEGPSRAVGATDRAIARLETLAQDKAAPFYMQVGYFEPHRVPGRNDTDVMGFVGDDMEPDDTLGVTIPGYLRDTPGTRQELAELQGSVRHMDGEFGRLMAALERLGLAENTLTLFTTDHGIAMPRAKCSLYDPGLEVAFIVRYPSRAGWHGGHTVPHLVSNLDFVPTVLELAGAPGDPAIQGQSFAPLLDGRPYTPRPAVFGEITYHDYYDPRRSVRTADHKLIVNFSSSYFFMDPSQSWRPRSDTVVPDQPARAYHDHVELYDLREDPWELRNVADVEAYRDAKQDLLNRLAGHLHESGDPILRGAVTSPMHETALQILDSV